MISIDGLHALAEALARLDFSAAQRDALEQAAQQLETSVRQTLSHRPGEDHSAPWLRTGSLRESIGHDASETVAAIGASDPVAVYRSLGPAAFRRAPSLRRPHPLRPRGSRTPSVMRSRKSSERCGNDRRLHDRNHARAQQRRFGRRRGDPARPGGA